MAGRRLWIVAALSAALLLLSGTAFAGNHHHESPPGAPPMLVRPLKLTVPDVTPPALAVLRPHDGATVSRPVVMVSGLAERASKVTLGETAVPVDRFGHWRTKVTLAKGLNTLTFTVVDGAGNVTTAVEHLTLVPLVLVVRGPHDGATVFWPVAFFRGWAQPGVTLSVNDAAVPLTLKGFWKVKLTLSEGLNTFTFTATDAAGNVTTIVKHVTFVPKPFIEKFHAWDHAHWNGWDHEAGIGWWNDHHWGWESSHND